MENFRNIVQVLPDFIDNIDNDDYNNDAGLDARDSTVKHHRAELAGEAEKHKAQIHEFEYVRILFHDNSILCFSLEVIWNVLYVWRKWFLQRGHLKNLNLIPYQLL